VIYEAVPFQFKHSNRFPFLNSNNADALLLSLAVATLCTYRYTIHGIATIDVSLNTHRRRSPSHNLMMKPQGEKILIVQMNKVYHL
jgi:hypothetical protein